MINDTESTYIKKVGFLLLFIFIFGAFITHFYNTLDFISYTYMMIYFFSFSVGSLFGMKFLFLKKMPFNALWWGILFLSISTFTISLSIQDFSFINTYSHPLSLHSKMTLFLMSFSMLLMTVGTLSSLSIYSFKVNSKIFMEIIASFVIFILLLKSLLPELDQNTSYYIYANSVLLTLIYSIFRTSKYKVCNGPYILASGLFLMLTGNTIIIFRSLNQSHFVGDIGDFFIIISGLVISMSIYELGKTFTQKRLTIV